VKFIGRGFDWTVVWQLISIGVSGVFFEFFWILTRVFTEIEIGMSFEFFHQNALEFFFSVKVSTKAFIKSAKNWMVVPVIEKVWRYLISVL